MRRLAVAVAALAVGALLYAGIASAAVPSPPSGWTLTWSDDFTGASGTGVPASDWQYDTGPGSNFGTGEIETMTNSTSNVYEDGAGHLVLKALHTGTNPTAGWTSGRIETARDDFGAPAGGEVMMQSSIQQPNETAANGLGYWPAFWMLGNGLRNGGTWPGVGEVDILEDVNSLSNLYGTLHCGVSPGGPCNETSGIGSGAHACSGCQTAYHTYAVQIDRSVSPEQIRWYLDGVNYFTVNSSQVDATTWANAVDHPFFIIYDLAMGGGFPNGVCGCTTPTTATASGGQLNADYVAVYNKAPVGWRRWRHEHRAGQDGNCLVARELDVPGLERGRRQPDDAVVVCVQRPAVAPGRSRPVLQHHARDAELGGRVRQGVPDPDVAGWVHLDDDLLDDDR